MGRMRSVVMVLGLVLFVGSAAMTDEMANAINRDDVEELQRLVDEGADVNAKMNNQQRYALLYAVAAKKTKAVDFLLANGADLRLKDDKGNTALHYCASGGAPDLAKRLIAKGAELDATNNSGDTPLFTAAAGQTDVARVLLEAGAEVNAKTKQQQTPLRWAVERAPAELVSLLLASNADPSIARDDGTTPLHAAAIRGDPQIVRLLIAKKPGLETTDRNGQTPLMRARNAETLRLLAEAGADVGAKDRSGIPLLVRWASVPGAETLAAVAVLLDKGADVNARDERRGAGYTALHWAAHLNSLQLAQLLLDRGADIEVKEAQGRTPLQIATEKGYKELAELLRNADPSMALFNAALKGDEANLGRLLAAGADPNRKNRFGRAPLHAASLKGHLECDRLLLAKKPEVNIKDRTNRTPLHFASAGGHDTVVELLLANGADGEINARDQKGQTSLHLAAAGGYVKVVQLLLDKGADPNLEDSDGNTPLRLALANRHQPVVQLLLGRLSKLTIHDAARLGDLDKVKQLLALGVDVNLKEKDGTTPLHLAAFYGHVPVVEYLISKGADLKAEGSYGTALGFAAWNRNTEAGAALLKAGDVPTVCAAVGLGDKEKLEALLAGGGSVEAKDPGERTPLQYAAATGDVALAQVLLDKGADLKARASDDSTLLHQAALRCHPKMVAYLLGKGLAANAKEKNYGYTPLHWAACYGYMEVTRALLEAGADVNTRSASGETPLTLARGRATTALPGHDYAKVVELLTAKGATE